MSPGIVFYRNSSIPLLEHWQKSLIMEEGQWDQLVLDKMLRSQASAMPDDNNYFKAWDKTLVTGMLPVAYFCSGHVYFVQKLPQELNVQPYAAHTTFVLSQVHGKLNRLREALLWTMDPPEYYKSPGEQF